MKKDDLQKKTAPPKKRPRPAKKKINESQPPERKTFPVVGIGAAAGGLEPLEAFFANIPTDKPPAASCWPSRM